MLSNIGEVDREAGDMSRDEFEVVNNGIEKVWSEHERNGWRCS